MRFFLIVSILLFFSACTYSIHDLYTSGFDPYGEFGHGHMVEAKSEQFTVLGMVGNTDYVDQAYRELQNQCHDGHIKGITTQYSTSHGFFSWTNKIVMQGMCVPGKS